MSIKDGVKYVKQELSSDEKLLEGALKIETFYKKYRLTIWGVVIVALLFVIANSILTTQKENRLAAANEAFLTLQADPTNQDALKILEKNNPNLYALLHLNDLEKVDTLALSNHWLILDIAKYKKTTKEGQVADSVLFFEMTQLANAKEALLSHDIDKASSILKNIGEDSPAFGIAQLLQHFTTKGN